MSATSRAPGLPPSSSIGTRMVASSRRSAVHEVHTAGSARCTTFSCWRRRGSQPGRSAGLLGGSLAWRPTTGWLAGLAIRPRTLEGPSRLPRRRPPGSAQLCRWAALAPTQPRETVFYENRDGFPEADGAIDYVLRRTSCSTGATVGTVSSFTGFDDEDEAIKPRSVGARQQPGMTRTWTSREGRPPSTRPLNREGST